MPMRILKTILQTFMYKRITHSLFFPRSYFFPLCQLGFQGKVNPQRALITFFFIIVIFAIAIRMVIRVTYNRLQVTACCFFRGCKIDRVESALEINRWNFLLLCKFRHCVSRENNSLQWKTLRLSDTHLFFEFIVSNFSSFTFSIHFIFGTISNL